MKIVTVIPLKKGMWKENLTYFTAQNIRSGSIVVIPLRNKKVLGLVISTEDATTEKRNIKDMSFNLKKVVEVKERSIFLPEYLLATIETSKYFFESKNNGITSLIPAPFRENYDKIAEFFDNKKFGNKEKKVPKNIKSEKMLFQAKEEDRISAYKTLIRGSFAQKKSVFIVLPTEYDIKNFEESLSRGIEQFTFSFYGNLSEKNILNKLEQLTKTSHPILILGTAPFLSIPRQDIETIIIEHESSTAYKTIQRPHFDLRFFIELFAMKINAKLILSDTLLRYETLAREELDEFVPLYPLSFRMNFNTKIEIKNINKKIENLDQNKNNNNLPLFKILSDENIQEIKNTIAKRKNVFIFSLRKGLATQTICKDCNELINCQKCGAPLVLYLSHQGKKRIFVCNRCAKEIDGDTTCRNCGSWNLIPLGIGTETVYEEIEKKLIDNKQVKIFKIDKESVKNAKDAEKIIKDFEGNPGSILIGTEMAFFYLKNKVPLSIVSSFDSLWSIPNFKMSEKIIQLIISLIKATKEKLIIQTKNNNDPLILAIESENLLSFVRQELKDRKNLNYPPFKRFIKITYMGDKEQTIKSRNLLEEIFKEYSPEIFSGFMAKLKDKYVTNALIKIDPKKWSLPEISTGSLIDENLFTKLSSLPINFEIYVDPEDLL